MTDRIRFNITPLIQHREQLKALDGRKVQVGWFSGNSARGSGSDVTNPELAQLHEFGNPLKRIPARSVLRMPLTERWSAIEATCVELLAKPFKRAEDARNFLVKLGGACENAVQAAFATGGFGQWKKLSSFTVAKKGHDRILIDTAMLSKTVASRVK